MKFSKNTLPGVDAQDFWTIWCSFSDFDFESRVLFVQNALLQAGLGMHSKENISYLVNAAD